MTQTQLPWRFTEQSWPCVPAAWVDENFEFLRDFQFGGFKTLEYFGVSNAAQDNTQAMQLALNSGYALRGLAGTYNFLSGLTLPAGTNLVLDPQCIFNMANAPANTTLLNVTGTDNPTVALTVNAVQGTKTLTMAATTGFTVGDYVRVASNAQFDTYDTDSELGEINQITALTATTLTLESPLQSTYNVSDSATVNKVNLVENIYIDGGRIVGGGQGANHYGAKFFLGKNISVARTSFIKTDLRGIYFLDTIKSRVLGCNFENFRSNTAYGVSVTNCTQDIIIANCTFDRVRHSLSTNNTSATKGIPRRILFASNNVTNSSLSLTSVGGDAIDTHAAAEDIYIVGNNVFNSSGVGINFECPSGIVANNYIKDSQDIGIYYHNESDAEGRILVQGNNVSGAASHGIHVNRGIRGTVAESRRIAIIGNSVGNVTGIGIYCNTPSGVGTNHDVVVSGNVVDSFGGSAGIVVEDVYCGSITGNSVARPTEADGRGITVRDSQVVTVTGNSIRVKDNSSNAEGIFINASSSGSCTKINIMDNIVTGVTPSSLTGIYLDDNATNCRAFNNYLSDCNTEIRRGTGTGHQLQTAIQQTSDIAAGVINILDPTTRVLAADTETASAFDQLDNLTNVAAGQMITIRSASNTRAIEVVNSSNIELAGATNFTLTNTADTLTLLGTGTRLLEVARSDNG